MVKCYICEKGNLANSKVEYRIYDKNLGKFNALVCNKCNETFFNEKTSNKIDRITKEKGLWGLEA